MKVMDSHLAFHGERAVFLRQPLAIKPERDQPDQAHAGILSGQLLLSWPRVTAIDEKLSRGVRIVGRSC